MKKILTLLVLLFISFPSIALETDWQKTSAKEEGAIRLISAGYDDYGKVISGLHIKFTGHWKTYWKNPGDSGLAITPDYSKSVNIKSSEMYWPAPKRHLFYDLEGWGYDDEVIMPISSEIIDSAKPAKLAVNVKWAVCDEDCIFVENSLELEIPAGYKNDGNLALIDNYILQVPQTIEETSTKLETVAVSDKDVVAEFSSSTAFNKDVDLFISESSKNFRFPKPTVTSSEDGKKLTIKTNYEVLKKGESLKDKTLNLVLRNGNGGVEANYKIDKLTVGSLQLKIDS